MTRPSEQPRLPGVRPSAGEASNAGRVVGRAPERPAPARPRTWRLEMPAGQELLNSNQRLHWSQRNRITQQLRSDAFFVAKYAKVPRLERARIDCVYEPPDSRRRDAGNWWPTYKAQIDGVVDAGVLVDDDHTRLDGPFMHIGEPHAKGRVVLIITELNPLQETPQ